MKALAVLLLVVSAVSPIAAQSINIDLGIPGTGPTAGYGGVGLPGVWNAFEATSPSNHYFPLDTYGQPTGVDVNQIGGTEIVTASFGAPGDPTDNDAVMMQDVLVTHTTLETCLFFRHLQNGLYEVTSYAMMPGHPETLASVHIDNNPTTYLVGGGWPGFHKEFVTFARHLVPVTTGFLGPHSGIPAGGNQTVGAPLSGIQIRLVVPQPPLFVSRTQLRWLVALNATSYDVVRGDLGILRSTGGDFFLATEACVANNDPNTELNVSLDPPPGQGDFYVVRGVTASGNLTYDEPGTTQVGSRDAEINSAAITCP